MSYILLTVLAFQPFNSVVDYTGDQDGKGTAVTSFGCISAGNTALDPSGNMQIITSAFDQQGQYLWCDSIHFGQSSEIYSLTECGDVIVYTGYAGSQTTSEDALAYAVDMDCQRVWTYLFEQSLQERFTSAAAGTDGQIVCAGSTNSQGAGGNDVLMVGLDQTGQESWVRTYGTSGEEAVYHISPCSGGGYVLACQAMDWGAGLGDYWIIRTDSAGDTLWTGTYGGEQFDYPWRVIQNGEFFFVAGNTLSYGEGSYDWWILKLDQNGNLIWSRTWGYENTDTCMALETLGDGVMVAGASEPTLNFFQATAVTFDGDGNVTAEWLFQPGMFRSVTSTGDGHFLFGGTTWTTSSSLWALCTDSTGYAPQTGIEDPSALDELTLHGNPVSAALTVSAPESAGVLSVRDLSGRVVARRMYGGKATMIDVTGLPSGIYTVSCEGAVPRLFAVVR